MLGVHAEILVRVVPKYRMFEKEFTKIQFGPFCSLYWR